MRTAEITNLIEELRTLLLGSNFSGKKVFRVMRRLRSLGHPQEQIETILLSGVCFHEAIGGHHLKGWTETHRNIWRMGLQACDIPSSKIEIALSMGHRFHVQHRGRSAEEVSQAAFSEYCEIE